MNPMAFVLTIVISIIMIVAAFLLFGCVSESHVQ